MSDQSPAPKNQKFPTVEWTLMFYFASDNPLASVIVSQLKALKDAGFHQEANVIAYFDPQTRNTPSHLFDVNMVEKFKHSKQSKLNFPADDPFVRNLVFDKLWTDSPEDQDTRCKIEQYLKEKYSKIKYEPRIARPEMGTEQDPQKSLGNFLDFCAENYPARHYMLIILGHGVVVGNDIFLFDFTVPEAEASDSPPPPPLPPPATDDVIKSQTDVGEGCPERSERDEARIIQRPARHSLTLRGLGDELKRFKDKINGGQLELLGLHSCSMSGLEVAYEVQDSTNYLLASQGPAFVGSWPYKQILMRVFNDLDAVLFKKPKDVDFAKILVKLKDEANAEFVKLCDPKMLEQPKPSRAPFIQKLTELLHEQDLSETAWGKGITLSDDTLKLKEKKPQGVDLMWLNRMILNDAFPEIDRGGKPELIETLKNIFSYCIANSFDFQLAGFSFDMALCDLSNLKHEQKGITKPLGELVAALKEGLNKEDGRAKKLILLAHWEALSFWQEQYTDLYDFCRRLHKKCEEEADQSLESIMTACKRVTKALERGKDAKQDKEGKKVGKDDDDHLVVRSEFTGPAFQYSRGMSIFFPWSRPVDEKFLDQYKQYQITLEFATKDGNDKVVKDENGQDMIGDSWLSFLNTYFEATMRATRFEEDGGVSVGEDSLERKLLLNALQSISRNAFGQLGDDVKPGSGSSTGDECDCPSIKNYPPVLRKAEATEAEPEKSGNELFNPDTIMDQIFGV